jgi:hypothetical protein
LVGNFNVPHRSIYGNFEHSSRQKVQSLEFYPLTLENQFYHPLTPIGSYLIWLKVRILHMLAHSVSKTWFMFIYDMGSCVFKPTWNKIKKSFKKISTVTNAWTWRTLGSTCSLWCLDISVDMVSIEDWCSDMVGDVWTWGIPESTCSLSCLDMFRWRSHTACFLVYELLFELEQLIRHETLIMSRCRHAKQSRFCF